MHRVMSALSEDFFCATWMYDCEYALWSDLQGSEAGGRKGWGISSSDREELALVHRLADGWIIWSNEEKDLRFLTTEAWLDHLSHHLAEASAPKLRTIARS